MNKINYKSDFDFIAVLRGYDAEGNEVNIGFPEYDWKMKISSSGQCQAHNRKFVASYIGGKAKNCFNDNGRIHIVCQDHCLPVGELRAEMISYVPNEMYVDNEQYVVTTHSLDIELVDEEDTTNQDFQAVLQMPIVVVGNGGGADMTKYLLKTEAEKTYAKKTDIPTDVVSNATLKNYATTEQLKTKQDALTAGEGIALKNNVISCTLDTKLYKVVVDLPAKGEENKIYLVESNEKGAQNIYIEYAYINGSWEILGEYRASVNLEPYALKTDIPTKFSQLENDLGIVDEIYELPFSPQSSGTMSQSQLDAIKDHKAVAFTKGIVRYVGTHIVNDGTNCIIRGINPAENGHCGYFALVIKQDLTYTFNLYEPSVPESETYVLNFTIKDGVNTGAYDATEYANLRQAIEKGKLIIIGGAVTRVTADSQAMASDYVVIRYSTPRISEDNKSVTISFYELKFSATEYTSKAIHKTIG